MGAYREIVEHPDYVAARRALDIDVRLLDEILEGVIDVISHIPHKFGIIKNAKHLRVVATRDWAPDKPRFIIYFSFNAKTVTLEYIHGHELDDTDYDYKEAHPRRYNLAPRTSRRADHHGSPAPHAAAASGRQEHTKGV